MSQVASLVTAAVYFFTGGRIGWFNVLISVILLLYLLSANVKRAFGRA